MTVQTIKKIIADFELAAKFLATEGQLIPGIGTEVGAAAGLADKLLQALQAGVQAHEAIAGAPLDLNVLHPIDPVP